MAQGVPTDAVGDVDDVTLDDPERVRALERTGLCAASDPDMEDHAEWARSALGAGAAVVSLVQPDRQVLPGAAGLGEPLETSRSVPLEQSVCKIVVLRREPLIVADVEEHDWLRDNALVRDARVRAYAGVPLTDRRGHVLGAIAAIDRAPRAWSERDRTILTRIARSCSTALRLRLADHDAGREERRRNEREAGLQRAFDRTQTLLGASQAFTETVTVDDVRVRIGELLTGALGAGHVDVVVADGRRRLHRLEASGAGGAPEDGGAGVGSLEDHSPASRAIVTGQVRHHPDRAAIDEAHPGASGDAVRALGVHSLVAAPLPTGEGAEGGDEIAGAVVLGWSRSHAVEPADLLTVATLAGFAGQALGRARRLSYRTGVAHEMQNAMLTTLPKVADLSMAARYTPADGRENVGGDWYDAIPLGDGDDDVLMLSVGDVVGHSLHAVTIMGQVRCMIRQAAADHPGRPPSHILDAFEAADRRFGVGATGTAIVARLARGPTGGWALTWTNAGHPPPILVGPDGRSELLIDHDVLFGFRLTGPGERRDHVRDLAPGSLLFLYTDGLVERRDSDIDSGIERVRRFLEGAGEREPRELVQAAVDDLAPEATDDVVAFAVRVPPAGSVATFTGRRAAPNRRR